MKIALDQSTDYSQRELYTLFHDIDVPKFVKDASVDTAEDFVKLAGDAFADTYNNAFPIDTPARVYVSNAYFFSKKAELAEIWGPGYVTKVAGKLKFAAGVFDIEKDLENFERTWTAKEGKDYQEEYIATVKVAGDKDVDLYKVKTAGDFVRACNDFAAKLGSLNQKFPIEWRRKIACEFVKKASKYGIDEIPDIIGKYAGLFYPSQTDIKDQLWYRATKLGSEEKQQAYLEKFEKKASEIQSVEDTFKFAEEVYRDEQASGAYFNKKVAQYLKDPVDAFFNLSVEKAAEILNVVEMAGEIFPVSDLKKVSSEIYKEAFGFDINPNDEGQLRDVLPTMPMSDVSLFKELSGIRGI